MTCLRWFLIEFGGYLIVTSDFWIWDTSRRSGNGTVSGSYLANLTTIQRDSSPAFWSGEGDPGGSPIVHKAVNRY